MLGRASPQLRAGSQWRPCRFISQLSSLCVRQGFRHWGLVPKDVDKTLCDFQKMRN